MTVTPDAIEIAFNAAVTLLDAQADSRFIVVGYQRQKRAAEVETDPALVQLFVKNWAIAKGSSSKTGEKTYDVRVGVQFLIAQPGELDVATISNPNSTPAERTAALLNMVEPAKKASGELFKASKAVREIFDDARNEYLGLPDYSIYDKWYDNYNQDDPPTRGGLGILTAISFLEFSVKEEQLGDIPVYPDQVTNDADLELKEEGLEIDPTAVQGVTAKAPETI